MSATVIYANLGLSASALGATDYTTAVTASTADERAYANGAVSAAQAAQTDTEFAAATMSNLGMSAAIIGQAAYDALLPAYAAYLASVGAANRGVVVVQLASIVAGLTADATFGQAATNLVNASNAALIYSSNAANTTALAIDVATVPAPVTSFALTTSTTDNLVGSALADTFAGVISALGTANTFQATDKVSGGEGSDTLNVSMGTSFTGFTSGSLTGVETVNLTSGAVVPLTFSANNVSGVTAYNLKGDIGLTQLSAAGVAVNLDGAQSGVTIGFTSKAVEGTADSLSLGLSAVGRVDNAATTTLDEQRSVAVTAEGIESLAITATGTNIANLANGAKAVSVSGAGSLKLTSIGAATKTVDASAQTGALDLNLSGATGVTSVSTGAGDDIIRLNGEMSATGKIDAGAGANKLVVGNSATSVTQYAMTGVQTLDLVNTAAFTLSAAKSSGITTINLPTNAAAGGLAAAAPDAAITLADMGAGAITVNVTKSNTNADLTSDNEGTTTINYAGVATDTATTRGDSKGTVTLGKSTGLAINVAANANLHEDADITANKATSVNLVAAGTLGTAAAVDINAAVATSVTAAFNSTSASNVKINTPVVKNVSISTSGTLDLTGSTFTKAETISIATANKAVTNVGDLSAANQITVSGTGTSAAITLGAIGANTLAYASSLTASGLKGGFTATTVDVAAGQSINAQVGGVTGNISLRAVNVANSSSGAYTGTATVNAAGAGGTVGIGKITAGTVNADFSNSVGTVTTDDFAGNSVTVNFAGASAVSASGTRDITAKNSVEYTGQGLVDDTLIVTAATGSTGLTAKITGGIGSDVVTINGVSGQTGITVTGDLGSLGTDTLTIASATSTDDQTISIAGIVNYNNATITAGSGKDTITGGADADVIYGGAGNDTINGGAGKDVIYGGTGKDTLTGGSGADVFSFNTGDSNVATFDVITDIQAIDSIVWQGGAWSFQGDGAGSTTTAAISTAGVATFAVTTGSTTTTLANKVTVLNAQIGTAGKAVLFAHDNASYLFIDTDGANTANDTGIVIQLAGLVLPTTVHANNADAVNTGLSGFGF